MEISYILFLDESKSFFDELRGGFSYLYYIIFLGDFQVVVVVFVYPGPEFLRSLGSREAAFIETALKD